MYYFCKSYKTLNKKLYIYNYDVGASPKIENLEMNEVIEILKEIDDSIDYENEKALIDDQLLDSFGVITLVSELEEAFDISIEASEMMPENFNSAKALWDMVCRLKDWLTE